MATEKGSGFRGLGVTSASGPFGPYGDTWLLSARKGLGFGVLSVTSALI